jgi:hypothetical protein
MGVRESRLQSPAQPMSARAAVGFLHDIRPAGGSEPRLDEFFFPGKGVCFHKAEKLDGPVSQPLGVVLWACLFRACLFRRSSWLKISDQPEKHECES